MLNREKKLSPRFFNSLKIHRFRLEQQNAVEFFWKLLRSCILLSFSEFSIMLNQVITIVWVTPIMTVHRKTEFLQYLGLASQWQSINHYSCWVGLLNPKCFFQVYGNTIMPINSRNFFHFGLATQCCIRNHYPRWFSLNPQIFFQALGNTIMPVNRRSGFLFWSSSALMQHKPLFRFCMVFQI